MLEFSPPNPSLGLVTCFLVLAGDWLSELARRLGVGSQGGGKREFIRGCGVEGEWELYPGKGKAAGTRGSQRGKERIKACTIFPLLEICIICSQSCYLSPSELELSPRCFCFPSAQASLRGVRGKGAKPARKVPLPWS